MRRQAAALQGVDVLLGEGAKLGGVQALSTTLSQKGGEKKDRNFYAS